MTFDFAWTGPLVLQVCLFASARSIHPSVRGPIVAYIVGHSAVVRVIIGNPQEGLQDDKSGQKMNHDGRVVIVFEAVSLVEEATSQVR